MATGIELPSTAQAEALFVSDLSAFARHTEASVQEAIRRAILLHGGAGGCAAPGPIPSAAPGCGAKNGASPGGTAAWWSGLSTSLTITTGALWPRLRACQTSSAGTRT